MKESLHFKLDCIISITNRSENLTTANVCFVNPDNQIVCIGCYDNTSDTGKKIIEELLNYKRRNPHA